jgi:hypothetical protein
MGRLRIIVLLDIRNFHHLEQHVHFRFVIDLNLLLELPWIKCSTTIS